MSFLTTLAALIKDAGTVALRGSGQSDVLYDKLLQGAYAAILARAPESDRAETEAILMEHGFEPDFIPYQSGPGECDLTGIDENCCPCGRHL